MQQRLAGSTAVITGGSGIVGSGIVSAFLQEGAAVIAPVRSDAGKSALLEDITPLGPDAVNRLIILVLGDFATDEEGGAAALAAAVTAIAPAIDHAVSCFGGGFKMGAISELAPADLHTALGRATPHLVAAHALLPLLRPSATSSFTFITGMLGERCSMPGAAALTVANAAIYGIARAAEAEAQRAHQPYRINELRIAALIRRDRAPGHPFVKEGHAFPASFIGEAAVGLAAGTARAHIERVWPEDLAAKEKEREQQHGN